METQQNVEKKERINEKERCLSFISLITAALLADATPPDPPPK